MFDNMAGFADQVFTCITLIVCAGISAHICHGYGTRKAKETFVGLVLLLAVSIQMYHIINASIHINTTKFWMYDEHNRRSDCTESSKGGKRPKGSFMHFDINPCYCHSGAKCVHILTNTLYNSTNTSCPRTLEYTCYNVHNIVIEQYINTLRDCNGGRGKLCTKNDPCTPCEVTTLKDYNADRCRSCTTDNPGYCNFVPDVGPYCYESPHSKSVIPCKRCCSDINPYKTNNDTCY